MACWLKLASIRLRISFPKKLRFLHGFVRETLKCCGRSISLDIDVIETSAKGMQVQEAIRHWRKSIVDPMTPAIFLAAAVICMISGPFGTLQAFSPLMRLLFWIPIFVVGGGISLFIRIYLRLRWPDVAKGWVEFATVVFFTSICGLPLVIWSSYLVGATNAPKTLPSQGLQLLYLAIVCSSFLWLRSFLLNSIRSRSETKLEAAETPEKKTPELPRLMKRLPDGQQTPILYLTADDHFVDVHTADATHRIRLRFKDAINEMEGVDGHYSHRSHWVSQQAIEGAIKSGNAWRLKLKNGEDIPVSRKYQPVLEEAGVLAPLDDG